MISEAAGIFLKRELYFRSQPATTIASPIRPVGLKHHGFRVSIMSHSVWSKVRVSRRICSQSQAVGRSCDRVENRGGEAGEGDQHRPEPVASQVHFSGKKHGRLFKLSD